MKRTYIIIPALEPESGLCRQIRELQEKIPSQVVVIDDGSGRDYREIFDRIEKMAGCIVLHHGENRGKGQALKTGFRYVEDWCISNLLDPGAIAPDKGEPVRSLSTPADSWTYSYSTPGIYTVSFSARNANAWNMKEIVRETVIEVKER